MLEDEGGRKEREGREEREGWSRREEGGERSTERKPKETFHKIVSVPDIERLRRLFISTKKRNGKPLFLLPILDGDRKRIPSKLDLVPILNSSKRKMHVTVVEIAAKLMCENNGREEGRKDLK